LLYIQISKVFGGNAMGRVLKFISGVSIPFQVITFLGSCVFIQVGKICDYEDLECA
jgi:hypothetical protein